MASLGLSGVSLALGAYNFTRIQSLQSALDVIEKTPIVPSSSSKTPTNVTEEVEPLSTNIEIVDLRAKTSIARSTLERISTRSATNESNIVAKGKQLSDDDITISSQIIDLSDKVGKNEVDIRQIYSTDLQILDLKELQTDLSNLSAKLQVSDEGIGSLVSATDDIQNVSVSAVNYRLNVVSETLDNLSDSVSYNTTNIQRIGGSEEMDDVTPGRRSATAIDNVLDGMITSLSDSKSEFEEFEGTAFVDNNLLSVTNSTVSNVNVLFGFVANRCKLYEEDMMSMFSHKDSPNNCLSHTSDGDTILSGVDTLEVICENSPRFTCESNLTTLNSPGVMSFVANGDERMRILSTGEIVFQQSFAGANATQFSTAAGENHIYAGEYKETVFGFGGVESIKLSASEIVVDETKIVSKLSTLKAKLKAYETLIPNSLEDIDTLERNTIKYNETVRLRNIASSQYLVAQSYQGVWGGGTIYRDELRSSEFLVEQSSSENHRFFKLVKP